MSREDQDRQFRSEMGGIIANVASGLFVKVVIAGVVLYAGIHGYHWVVNVFAPVKAALG